MNAVTMTANGAMPTVWIAYYSDWSGFGLFGSEIEALRFAVTMGAMNVAMIVMPCDDVRLEVVKQAPTS